MPLELRPAVLEDIPGLVDVYFAAFRTNPIHKLCFPDTPAVRKFWESNLANSLENDSLAQISVAVDASLPDRPIAAFAKWIAAQPYVATPLPTWPADGDRELAETFYGALKKCRAKNLQGKRVWELGMLMTRPEYQGQGAAGRLLRLGLDQADRDGCETYVEASQMARPVYARFGFEDVDELVYLGGEFKEYTMLRKARAVRE